jgi:hypothetical protein
MIHEINLMVCHYRSRIFSLTSRGKQKKKRGCFACQEKGHFRDNYLNMAEPKKRRSKGKDRTNVKTWYASSSEDEPQRSRGHRSSHLSHECLMAKGKNEYPIL